MPRQPVEVGMDVKHVSSRPSRNALFDHRTTASDRNTRIHRSHRFGCQSVGKRNGFTRLIPEENKRHRTTKVAPLSRIANSRSPVPDSSIRPQSAQAPHLFSRIVARRQGLPDRNRHLDRNQLLDRTDRHDRIVSANRRRISRSFSNSEGHLTRIAT